MATAGHHLDTLDDSGETAVSVCECGRSFIGWGNLRLGIAKLAWARHDRDAGEAMGTAGARASERITSTPHTPAESLSALVHGIDGARVVLHPLNRNTSARSPKSAPSGPSKSQQNAEHRARIASTAAELLRSGVSVSAAARYLRVDKSTLNNWLRSHGYGDLIRTRQARP